MVENEEVFCGRGEWDSPRTPEGGLAGKGGASRTGRDGSCGSGGRSGIAPDSLTRQLPTTPKGD